MPAELDNTSAAQDRQKGSDVPAGRAQHVKIVQNFSGFTELVLWGGGPRKALNDTELLGMGAWVGAGRARRASPAAERC